MALPLIGFVIIGYVWISLAPQAKILGLSWIAVGIVVAIYFAVKKKDTTLDI